MNRRRWALIAVAYVATAVVLTAMDRYRVEFELEHAWQEVVPRP